MKFHLLKMTFGFVGCFQILFQLKYVSLIRQLYHNNKGFMYFFFSDKEKYRGGKTMVHCHAGISRSATICLAYIMYNENLDLNTAFEFVKSRKHEISPNLSFMQQLVTFEKEVLCRTPTAASPCRSLSVPSGITFFNLSSMSSPVLVSPTTSFS